MIYVGLAENKLSGTIRYENITVEQFDRMQIELTKIFGEDGVKVTGKPFHYCKGYRELIRSRCVELGMSMRGLAKASGINVSSLSRYQNGTINLTDETLKKVLNVLGLTMVESGVLKGDKIERTENADHDLGKNADDSESSEDGSDSEKDI